MDSRERVSSKIQPKYVTLENVCVYMCVRFILMLLYWVCSGLQFLILSFLLNKIDFF